MKSALLTSVCACGLLQAGSAAAADSSTGVVPPELRADPASQVVPIRADLRVTARQIDLTLVLSGASPAVASYISIVTPAFSWRGEADPYPDRQYPELQVLVDGRPAVTQNSFSASTDSVDVSDVLRTAGIDPFEITESPPIVDVSHIAPETLDRLQSSGAIAKDEEAGYLAKWSAQRTIRAQLPATARHELTIRYTARPAFSLQTIRKAASAGSLTHYCVTAAQLDDALAEKSAATPFVFSEFAISTAVNDKVPSSVHVQISGLTDAGSKPVTLFALCDQRGSASIQRGTARLEAQTDGHGMVHILAIRRR